LACPNCKCTKLKNNSLPVQVEVKLRPEAPEGAIMTGTNTQLFINGERFPWAKSFKFEVDSKSVAKCTIEFYGHVLIDGKVQECEWVGLKDK
jgi:hypothetical protein